MTNYEFNPLSNLGFDIVGDTTNTTIKVEPTAISIPEIDNICNRFLN